MGQDNITVEAKMFKDLERVVKKLWGHYKKPAKVIKATIEKGVIIATITPSDNPQDIYWSYNVLGKLNIRYWERMIAL